MERFKDLSDFYKAAWNLMYRAAVSRNDPMRTPVMATVADNQSHQRTIVLRAVDTKQHFLYFFSDARAPKIEHLKNNPACNLVLYDAQRKVQIEVQATGLIFQEDEKSRDFWERINVAGRKSYATIQAPGSPMKTQQSYLPARWSQEMELKETEFAYGNFALLQLTALKMDVLHLHQEGHQRAVFTKKGTSDWGKTWVVP